MPWNEEDVARHNAKAAKSPKLNKMWRDIANSHLEKTGDEAEAIKIANGVLKKRRNKKKEVKANTSYTSKQYNDLAKRTQKLHNEIEAHALKKTKESHGSDKRPTDKEEGKKWDEHYSHHFSQHPKLHEYNQVNTERAKAKTHLKRTGQFTATLIEDKGVNPAARRHAQLHNHHHNEFIKHRAAFNNAPAGSPAENNHRTQALHHQKQMNHHAALYHQEQSGKSTIKPVRNTSSKYKPTFTPTIKRDTTMRVISKDTGAIPENKENKTKCAEHKEAYRMHKEQANKTTPGSFRHVHHTAMMGYNKKMYHHFKGKKGETLTSVVTANSVYPDSHKYGGNSPHDKTLDSYQKGFVNNEIFSKHNDIEAMHNKKNRSLHNLHLDKADAHNNAKEHYRNAIDAHKSGQKDRAVQHLEKAQQYERKAEEHGKQIASMKNKQTTASVVTASGDTLDDYKKRLNQNITLKNHHTKWANKYKNTYKSLHEAHTNKAYEHGRAEQHYTNAIAAYNKGNKTAATEHAAKAKASEDAAKKYEKTINGTTASTKEYPTEDKIDHEKQAKKHHNMMKLHKKAEVNNQQNPSREAHHKAMKIYHNSMYKHHWKHSEAGKG